LMQDMHRITPILRKIGGISALFEPLFDPF
jgi:hypothetical protein